MNRRDQTLPLLLLLLSAWQAHATWNAEVAPPWLKEYVEFHQKERGQPSAKYLVWVCFGAHRAHDNLHRDPITHQYDCLGLGDRLRGIEYALKLAYTMKRVLLIRQEQPAPMQTFLMPGALNWMVTRRLNISLARSYHIPHLKMGGAADETARHLAALKQGVYHRMDNRVITIAASCPPDTFAGPGQPAMEYYTAEMHSVATALFQLSPEVLRRARARMAGMGLALHQPYLAAHLRLGHLVGEDRLYRHRSKIDASATNDPLHLKLINATTMCAARLAMAAGLPRPPALPVVLITDHLALRALAVRGLLPPWRSPDVTPVHLRASAATVSAPAAHAATQAAKADVEAHINSMVDFAILSHARCLALTRSGFSRQALLLGGTYKCYAMVDSCKAPVLKNSSRTGTGAPGVAGAASTAVQPSPPSPQVMVSGGTVADVGEHNATRLPALHSGTPSTLNSLPPQRLNLSQVLRA